QPMKNQLWALTHPGNLAVERWRDSMLRHDGGKLEFDSSAQTKSFFKECVRPVGEGITEFEEELAAKYGVNKSPKPDPDKLDPRLFGVWQKLQTNFLSGDILDEISEFGESSEPVANPVASTKGNKK
ncbi:MAG TPA: hypothetical protein PKD50_21160, partial [Leptospiraceae bacterium]|nr:hypothetical protein [Leptospiraceae bacterium]